MLATFGMPGHIELLIIGLLCLERISKPNFGRAKLLLSRVLPRFRLGGSLTLPVLKPILVMLAVPFVVIGVVLLANRKNRGDG